MWRGLVLVWAFFSVVASQPVTGKETPTVFLHAATKILLDTLPGTRGRPFTLFVPNDDAFESAGVDVNELSAEEITNGVMSHIYVGGALTPGDLNGSATVKISSATGTELRLAKVDGKLKVNEANVIRVGQKRPWGVIHIIDQVLEVPNQKTIVETAVSTPALSTLVSVLTMPAYAPVLAALSSGGPFTVFAPTNEAFAEAGVDVNDVAAVTEVLKYHVVAGAAVASTDLKAAQSVESFQGALLDITKNARGVFINGDAKVVLADVVASDGIVHVIDAVLIPPAPKTIVETAVSTPALSTLVSVLTMPAYAPVLAALSSGGPFTVFAPTNEAFAEAGVDVNDVAAVTEVLKYHVVAGAAVASTDLKAAQSVESVLGENLHIVTGALGVTINGDAKVVLADVVASDGIVHVVDTVILPLTMRDPLGMIANAIDEGIPAFNAGRESECYQRYLGTCLALKDMVVGSVRGELGSFILAGETNAEQRNFFDAAWDLRRGLDLVADSIESPPAPAVPPSKAIPPALTTIGSSIPSLTLNVIAEIERAIAVGAPLYNQGDKQGCAETYIGTGRKVLPYLSGPSFAQMRNAVEAAQGQIAMGDYDSAAWSLRSGFDFVIANWSMGASPLVSSSGPLLASTSSIATGNRRGPAPVSMATFSWDIQDDRVMGGISRSSTKVVQDPARGPVVEFSGYTTTESNGGFSFARASFRYPKDYSMCRGVILEIKGDNQRYTVDFRPTSGRWGDSFDMDIYPSTEWQSIEIPFDQLFATHSNAWMGIGPSAQFLDASSIYSMAIKRSVFTLDMGKDRNFKSGNFKVQMDKLRCL